MNNFVYGRIIKKNNKKIVILTKKIIFFSIYKKKKKIFTKLNALDLYNESNFGDYVCLKKSRPIKKTIFFVLNKILEKIKLI